MTNTLATDYSKSSKTDSQQTPNSEKSRTLGVCPLCGKTRVSVFLKAPDRFHLRAKIYTLLRCADCECIWLDSPPTPGEMAYHYSNLYHHTIAAAAEHKDGNRWKEHRAIIGRYKQSGDILDVGCSSGSFLAGMKSGDWKLYGIEMDQETAERAKAASGAEVYVGDIMDAPFAAESFDVITAFDVLEHMYEPRQFLERIIYWLKPGGIFFAKSPNIECWESRLYGSYWYGLELPRHLFHFTKRSLANLVSDLGIRESDISARGSYSYAHHSTRYLFGTFQQKIGIRPVPLAESRRAGIIWRAVRKALGLGLAFPFSRMAAAADAGVAIDLVIKKPANRS